MVTTCSHRKIFENVAFVFIVRLQGKVVRRFSQCQSKNGGSDISLHTGLWIRSGRERLDPLTAQLMRKLGVHTPSKLRLTLLDHLLAVGPWRRAVRNKPPTRL